MLDNTNSSAGIFHSQATFNTEKCDMTVLYYGLLVTLLPAIHSPGILLLLYRNYATEF